MNRRPINQLLASLGLGLGLAIMSLTAPMTDGVQAATQLPPIMRETPSGGYTIKDMHDCAASGSNSEFVCYGPDNKTYVCKLTGPCKRVVGW
jgi:hypothetical protein